MLSSISWLEFIEFIFAVLFFYYTAVLILFYRVEMSAILTKVTALKKDKQPLENTLEAATDENKKADDFDPPMSLSKQENQDTITFSDTDISNIYVELEEAIAISKEKKYTRQELLTSLQLVLKKCTICAGTDLSTTINSQIQSHLTINAMQTLNGPELSQIWSK